MSDIVQRQLFDEDVPDGYVESDKDFVNANHDKAVELLERELDGRFNVLDDYEQDRCIGKHVEVDGKTYDIEVRYELGGMNYFSSRTEPRGIFLGVTPVEKSTSHGATWKSFTAFSGIKVLLQPLKRYNRNKLYRIAHQVFGNMAGHEKLNEVFDAVVAKNA